MEQQVFQFIKTRKFADIEVVKKRQLDVKILKEEFDIFLSKEVEQLIADSRELDGIRVIWSLSRSPSVVRAQISLSLYL